MVHRATYPACWQVCSSVVNGRQRFPAIDGPGL